VWTGKEAGLRPSRDTAVVVREPFARAEKSVVIGGFRFDHGEEILAPLYQAMNERGAEVKIFVDIERAKPGQDPDKVAAAAIERFYATNWPFGHPRPELFFDPETVAPGAQTSLHAKCLVVDRRWALVSSANFTERGLTRNLEAGVLIEDTTFARRLSEQWLALVDSGQMKPYRQK
jgi:phosphatidylserine/phosphatidylglycerophosphate/cardiolipin synthase-like enzyme